MPEALALRGLLGADAEIMAWLYGPGATSRRPCVRTSPSASRLRVPSIGSPRPRAAGIRARVHLKIDSGLGRNGLAPEDIPAVLTTLRACAEEDAPPFVVSGIMSHFAVADEPERPETARSRRSSTQPVGSSPRSSSQPAAASVRPPTSTSTSRTPRPHSRSGPCRAPRPGSGSPSTASPPLADADPGDLGLTPVMRLVSEVVNLKHIPAGHGASYGLTYTAEADTRFALVPGGYGDGVPRSASNRAEVSIRGQRFPIVGRIAMDQFIVDVGDAEVAIGDEVVLFGPGGPSAAEWGTGRRRSTTRSSPA